MAMKELIYANNVISAIANGVSTITMLDGAGSSENPIKISGFGIRIFDVAKPVTFEIWAGGIQMMLGVTITTIIGTGTSILSTSFTDSAMVDARGNLYIMTNDDIAWEVKITDIGDHSGVIIMNVEREIE